MKLGKKKMMGRLSYLLGFGALGVSRMAIAASLTLFGHGEAFRARLARI
jgi:hypothetical protein